MKVQRLHLSSYYGEAFIQKEQELVESLGFDYIYNTQDPTKMDPESKIIISTSQVDWSCYSKEQISALELIIHPNSGYDNFKFEIFKDFKAPVLLGNHIRAQAVAEYSIACLYQHFCPLPFSKKWDSYRSFPKRRLIKDSSILIFGMGHVGRILSENLLSLDAKVFIQDPYLNIKTQIENQKFDAIIMACSLNKYNHQIINKKILDRLRPNGCFINAARGKLVHLDDLFSFLAKNSHANAYLDVTPDEPFQTEEFSQFENIKLTSHISGVSEELNQNALSFIRSSLRKFQENNFIPEQTLAYRMRDDYFI